MNSAPVEKFTRLLGEDVFLVPCEWGTKKPVVTYVERPFEGTKSPAYRALFENEPRFEQAHTIEAQLASELEPCRKLPGVIDVRVKGAIGVVQLEKLDDITELKDRFAAKGAWIRPFGDIVYLTPSLIIEEADLTTLTRVIAEVLADR